MGLPATPLFAQAEVRPGPSRRKVLLVTSNERTRLVETQAVACSGDECVCASGLMEAVALTQSLRPSVVLVDATTAWAEGTEACAHLKAELAGRIPMTLLAELDSPVELLEDCWNAGFDDCLIRPLRMAQVQARLTALAEAPARNPREVQRTVLLYGEPSATQDRLRRILERNGHRVLERSVHGGLGALDTRVDLLMLRWDVGILPGLLSACRGDPSLAQTPALLLTPQVPAVALADPRAAWVDESRMDTLVSRANAELGCPAQALRAEDGVPFFCPVEFREWGSKVPGAWSTGLSYEVSSGGLFVQTLVPLRPRIAVEMRLHLTTTREEVPATGVVAWSHRWNGSRDVGMAVQFLGMPVSRKLMQLIELCRGG